MHQWDDAINDAMNDEMNAAVAFDDALAATLLLLPVWRHATPDQMRDLANGLRYLSDHFKVVSQKPSLLPDRLAHYRALHAEGMG